MEAQFCFMCGAPTMASIHRAVPICPDCRGRRASMDPTVCEWMLQRPGERSKGPMTREAVVHAVARDRVGPDDSVGRLSGEMMSLGDHPDFRGCWIPGSSEYHQIEQFQTSARRSLLRSRVRRVAGRVGAFGLLSISIGILVVGVQSRIFVAPSEWFDKVEALQSETMALVDQPETAESFHLELPHDRWIRDKVIPAMEEHRAPETAFFTGQVSLWSGGTSGRLSAYKDLMAAVGHTPSDPEVLGLFVEAAASLRDVQPGTFVDASRALGRLEASTVPSLVVARAGASVDLAEGNSLRAAQRTADCATQGDLGCRLIHAEATSDGSALERLVLEYPDSNRIRLAYARVLLGNGDYVGLESETRLLVQRLPNEGESFALRAESCAATARWKQARKAADRAVMIDAWRTETLHLAAAISLRIEHRPKEALTLFETLIAHPRLDRASSRANIFAQAADAARQAGRQRLAGRWADEALRTDKHHVGAKLIKATIHLSEADLPEAKSLLRSIEYAADDQQDLAWSHLWAGRMYLALGLQRTARTELESAIEADPLLLAPRRELAGAQLETGDLEGVVSTVHKMVWLNPRAQVQGDPRLASGPGSWEPRAFFRDLQRALAADVRLEPERTATVALLAWVDGRPRSIRMLREALGWEDGRLELRAALAQALLENEEWEAAIRHADHVVKVRPKAGLFYAVLGRGKSKLKAPVASTEAFELALKHAPDDPTVLWWAIEARLDQGDRTGARVLLEKLLRSDVNIPAVEGVLLALEAAEE